MKLKTLYRLAKIFIALALASIGLKHFSRPKPLPLLASGGLAEQAFYFEIERDTETFRFSRNASSWQMTSPFQYPADSKVITGLIARLPETTLSQPLSSNYAKFDIFGLGNSSGTKISVYDARKLPLIEFTAGRSAQDADSFYSLDRNRSEVRQALGVAPGEFARPMQEWLDKTVCRMQPDSVDYISIKRKASAAIKLSRRNDAWYISRFPDRPNEIRISTASAEKLIEPMLAALADLQADKTFPAMGSYADTPAAGTPDIALEIGDVQTRAPLRVKISERDQYGQRKIIKENDPQVTFSLESARTAPFQVNYDEFRLIRPEPRIQQRARQDIPPFLP